MKLYTSEQCRKMDALAINEYSIPSALLMERAARFVADEALFALKKGGHVSVLCGSGNNGGDGIGAAYMLRELGVKVRVFLTGKREKMTPDSREMERRLISLGGVVEDFSSENFDYIRSSEVIIDALFGVGFSSAPRGKSLEAIGLINSSNAFVIAADIPSGVEADTGFIPGEAVKADMTVSFSVGKPGLYSLPGALFCGEVKTCDIGIPMEIYEGEPSQIRTVTDVSLPKRKPDSHKGDFGRELIVAGSVGYTGAPILAANACLRSGGGLITLCVPEKAYPIIAVKCNEVMPVPAPCGEDGLFSENAAEKILSLLSKSDACLIGPGLGRSDDITKLVHCVIRSSSVPLVVDADGINALAQNINILDEVSCPIILTPHDGEFKRLGGDLENKDRIESAREFAFKHHCTVVLKGHRTVTAFPDGEVFINTTGNPGMAKGGSGDVLAGIMVSLIGQGIPLKEAVTAAVFIHGKTGDICRDKYGEYFMTPSDITDSLYTVLKNVTR